MSCVDQRRFTTGRLVLGVAALLVALATVLFWLRAPPDPVYKGRRLSSYLYDLRQPMPPAFALPGNRQMNEQGWNQTVAAMDALEALGPAAVPLIVEWMKPESTLHGRLRRLAFTSGSRFGEWLARIRWVRTSQTDIGYKAATLASQHCAAMIPMLRADLISEGLSASRTAQLLETIVCTVAAEERSQFIRDNGKLVRRFAERVSTNGLSPVTACMLALTFANDPPADTYDLLRRRPHWRRAFEVADIRALDPDGSYRTLLDLEFGEPDQRAAAARSLADLRAFREKVVPFLIANLSSHYTNVLFASSEALTAYATEAAPALPALVTLLTNADSAIVAAASNAIARIEMAQSVRANIP
jgi:hypothetical protein